MKIAQTCQQRSIQLHDVYGPFGFIVLEDLIFTNVTHPLIPSLFTYIYYCVQALHVQACYSRLLHACKSDETGQGPGILFPRLFKGGSRHSHIVSLGQFFKKNIQRNHYL